MNEIKLKNLPKTKYKDILQQNSKDTKKSYHKEGREQQVENMNLPEILIELDQS